MLSKLIVGRDEKLKIRLLERILGELGLKINDPDVLVFERDEKVGIPETKKVRAFLSIKPIGKNKVVIFWQAENISSLAQNALLKTIEDISSNGVVILIGDTKEALLPTLMSRVELVMISVSGEHELVDLEAVRKWMNLSVEERFKMIEKIEEKDKFLNEMVVLVREKLTADQKWVEFAKKVLQAESFRRANGNQRAILEWLALELSG